MAKQLTQNEMYHIVMDDEILHDKFLAECNKAGLMYHSKLFGGCSKGEKRIGITRFTLAQKSIAQSIYLATIQTTPTMQDLSLTNRAQMFAKDMFLDKTLQVFSKKTGEYLGLIRQGEQLMFSEEVETREVPVTIDKKQLSLF